MGMDGIRLNWNKLITHIKIALNVKRTHIQVIISEKFHCSSSQSHLSPYIY